MKFSVKTSIIISAISAMVWAALFALFYLSEHDYGNFSEISFAQVRGASAERFTMSSDEIFIAAKQANGDYKEDKLLLSKRSISEDTILRVIRDNIVMFEQRIFDKYTKVIWDNSGEYFEVSVPDSEDNFLLKPSKDGYLLIPSD